MIQKQTVYLPVKVEDELPHEFNIVTFIAKVPVINQFEKLTSETEIDFSFKGWLEDGKFLMHGLGEELAEGKVTHWLKEQDAFVFTSEQLNEYTADVIKQTLETAAEEATIYRSETDERYDGVNQESITNTFEESYKKFKV